MLDYINDMLRLVCTDNKEVNEINMMMLTEQIYLKVKGMAAQQGEPAPNKQSIKEFLQEIQADYFRRQGQANSTDAAEHMKSIGESILRTGIFVVIIGGQSNKALTGAALGSIKNGVKHTGLALTRCYCWIFVGFVLVAQTGIDYRKLRKGLITKREFYRNARTRTVMSLVGLATGAAGASIGFAVGTIIFPGLGSAVGAVIGTMLGGIGGSTVGRNVSAKAYGIIEDRMEANSIEKDLKRDYEEEKE